MANGEQMKLYREEKALKSLNQQRAAEGKEQIPTVMETEAAKQASDQRKYDMDIDNQFAQNEQNRIKNDYDQRKNDHDLELNERKQIMAEDKAEDDRQKARLDRIIAESQEERSTDDQGHKQYMDNINNERELAKLEMEDDDKEEERKFRKEEAAKPQSKTQTAK